MTRHFGGRVAHGLVVFGFMLVTLFFLFKAGSRLGEQLLEASRRGFGSDGASLARRMAESVRSTVTGLVFNKVFFAGSDPRVGTLQAFGVYFVGFVARPIGAAIFGHYGDRIGR